MPWETTKDYKQKLRKLSVSGNVWDGDCSSEKEILDKYKTLDDIFAQVKYEGKNKTRQGDQVWHFS